MIEMLVCIPEVSGEGTRHVLAVHRQELSVAAPAIAISREGSRVKITFTGSLQSADSVTGPWNDVSNAASPFDETPANIQRFYRAAVGAPDSIFSSHSMVA